MSTVSKVWCMSSYQEKNHFHDCHLFLLYGLPELCQIYWPLYMLVHISNAFPQSLWKPFRLLQTLAKLSEGSASLSEQNREKGREAGAVCHLCGLLWGCDAAGCCQTDSAAQTNSEEKEQLTEPGKALLCFVCTYAKKDGQVLKCYLIKTSADIRENTLSLLDFLIFCESVCGQTLIHQSQRFLPENRLKITPIKRHSCSVRARKEWEREWKNKRRQNKTSLPSSGTSDKTDFMLTSVPATEQLHGNLLCSVVPPLQSCVLV